MWRRGTAALALCLWTTAAGAQGWEREWSGFLSVQNRTFAQSALYDSQERADASIVLAPEVDLIWDQGVQVFSFEGFVRLDGVDSQRTHVDVRELFWERVWDRFELRAGMRHVFWGVTESQHLVDVVNQTDLVERLDGEAKLGQAMVQLSLIDAWGNLDLFFLPWFRERTFPGMDGRLRPPLPVDGDAIYDEGDFKRHLSFAGRWVQTVGAFDLGLSHFWGTSRDPLLILDAHKLVLRYDRVHQSGLELQAITGGWLWKLEAIHRSGQRDRFTATTAGFEYTFSNLRSSGADIGLLVEYLWDERDEGLTPFADDVFVGTRLALNDVQSSELLGGAVVDRSSGTSAALVEASRRLGSNWKLELEVRGFLGVDEVEDPFYSVRRDGHVELKIARWF